MARLSGLNLAFGSSNGASDLLGAMYYAMENFTWDADVRFFIVIANNPCYGREFHSAGVHDSYVRDHPHPVPYLHLHPHPHPVPYLHLHHHPRPAPYLHPHPVPYLHHHRHRCCVVSGLQPNRVYGADKLSGTDVLQEVKANQIRIAIEPLGALLEDMYDAFRERVGFDRVTMFPDLELDTVEERIEMCSQSSARIIASTFISEYS